MRLLRRPAAALALIALVTLAARLAALPFARPDTLTPDGARFLNLARAIARGEGYVTPEAYPAWLAPARLPCPETIKEPGYPYAIAALAPLAGGPFRAGQWVSLLAGLLVPFAAYALARALERDRAVAALAGLLAAASPLLIVQSVYVMADSLAALVVTLALAAAAWRPRGDAAARGWGLDLAAGALLGLAYLVRAQALLALPALAWLLLAGRPWRRGSARLAAALVAAALVMAPWLARNLRLFGNPFHSDVTAFGLWPYVDMFTASHRLERPPSALLFALGHPHAVARVVLASLRDFTLRALPDELLGSRVWLAPLAIGLVLALRRWRAWGAPLLFAALSAAFLFPLYWLTRYFAPVAPLLCALTALGLVAVAGPGGARLGPAWTRALAAIVVAGLLALSAARAVRRVPRTYHPELEAASALAPWLEARLAPGEAVMGEMTSYWAWCCDRPAVYPVVADSARFAAVARRYRVRVAALSDSVAAGLAARSPDGRLPSSLVPLRREERFALTLYAVRP